MIKSSFTKILKINKKRLISRSVGKTYVVITISIHENRASHEVLEAVVGLMLV
jgi:hypothetical protein